MWVPTAAQASNYLGDNHPLSRRGHTQLAELLAPAVRRALDGAPPAAPPRGAGSDPVRKAK